MKTRRKNYQRENSESHENTQKGRQKIISKWDEAAVHFKPDTNVNNHAKTISQTNSRKDRSARFQEASSLHRQVRKRFKRRKVITYFPYDIIMSDLIDYNHSKMPHANGGYRYIMVFVDAFSKVAWAEPLKRKDGINSLKAFEKTFQRMQEIPNTLITDRGLEYYDGRVQAFLKRFGVRHYNLTGPHKACIAERFIKTLKSRLERYFWANKTKRWYDVLPEVINSYNNTYHRSIRMAPNHVNEKNRSQVFKHLFPNIKLRTKPRLNVGDRVRLLKEKSIFDKGYKRSWSMEIYKVKKCFSENRVDYYRIEDLAGNEVPRKKYYWELNRVSKNDT